jgi:hypothetical protein
MHVRLLKLRDLLAPFCDASSFDDRCHGCATSMCQECYNTHVCDDDQEEEENAKEDHATPG